MKIRQLPPNPFIGLRPFESEESMLFFGRFEQTAELLKSLHENRFLSVVGSSGCGKSSLIRAGLIPKLKAGFLVQDRDQWNILTMKPGDRPLYNLSQAILESINEEKDPAAVNEFLARISEYGVRIVVKKLAEISNKKDTNFLLLVDQFEEIFRFILDSKRKNAEDEANEFVSLLLSLSQQDVMPIYTVMTMRSDFLGDCSLFHGLPEAINKSQFLVPRLNRKQRKQAIVGPVHLYKKKITNRLVDRILNDVGEDSDQLPVMQHVLMRTWEHWQQNPNGSLDLENYKAIGTISFALSKHADEALDDMTEKEKNITKRMFQALTDTDAGNRRIRRPAKFSEIKGITGATQDELIKIINRFRSGGRSFLVLSTDKIADDPLIDISHESLIRQWKTLRDWVDEEAESAKMYFLIADAAERYRKGLVGLWHDPELQLALEWIEKRQPNAIWAKRYFSKFKEAMTFLEKSQAHRDAEIAAEEAARKRELQQARQLAEEQRKRAEEQERSAKRLRVLLTALIAMFCVAVVAAFYAFNLRDIAEEHRRKAEEQADIAKEQARRADSLYIRVNSLYKTTDSLLSIKAQLAEDLSLSLKAQNEALAVARYERNRANDAADSLKILAKEQIKLKDEAISARNTVMNLRQATIAAVLAAQAKRAQEQENFELGSMLARQAYLFNESGNGQFNNEVYDALRKTLNATEPVTSNPPGGPAVLDGHLDWVRCVAFDPSGRFAVSGGGDGYIFIWAVKSQPFMYQPFVNTAISLHVELSIKGKLATMVNSIKLPSGIRCMDLSPDGESLVVGCDDHSVRLLLNLSNNNPEVKMLGHHVNRARAIRFNPDGKRIVSAGANGGVYFWDIKDGKTDSLFLDQDSSCVKDLCFSPDGRILALACANGHVKLLEWQNPQKIPVSFSAHKGGVNAIAYSSDGSYLATGGEDTRVCLWRITETNQAPTLVKKLLGNEGPVNDVVFNRENTKLASAGSDKSLRLWDLQSQEINPIVLRDHESWVWSVAFHPTEDKLISASADRTLRLWITDPLILADRICEKTAGRVITKEEWQTFVGEDFNYEDTYVPCLKQE